MLARIGVPDECRGFRRDIVPKLFREDLYTRALDGLPFHPPTGPVLAADPVHDSLKSQNRSRAA